MYYIAEMKKTVILEERDPPFLDGFTVLSVHLYTVHFMKEKNFVFTLATILEGCDRMPIALQFRSLWTEMMKVPSASILKHNLLDGNLRQYLDAWPLIGPGLGALASSWHPSRLCKMILPRPTYVPGLTPWRPRA